MRKTVALFCFYSDLQNYSIFGVYSEDSKMDMLTPNQVSYLIQEVNKQMFGEGSGIVKSPYYENEENFGKKVKE